MPSKVLVWFSSVEHCRWPLLLTVEIGMEKHGLHELAGRVLGYVMSAVAGAISFAFLGLYAVLFVGFILGLFGVSFAWETSVQLVAAASVLGAVFMVWYYRNERRCSEQLA